MKTLLPVPEIAIGAGRIDQLGADNILYEDDYPHMLSDNGVGKGSAGNIETSLQHIKDSKVRHKLLAGNAVRLFGLGS